MNTKKTLADAQPGGRVQVMPSDAARALLAAQYRDDGDKAKAIRINHKSLTDSDKRALRAIEAALSAQPSPGGQGGALLESLVARWRKDADEVGISDNTLCQKIANCTMRHAAELQAVLAARQPVELIAQKVGAYRVTVAEDAITVSHGRDIVFAYSAGDAEPINARQPVGEPVGYACTNCDRTDEVVICQTCAGMAWDNGRLHEFHEVRELSTSLGEGVLDHLLPDEWHEKPLARFQGAFDEGDRSVGIGERCGNVLAADQSGTVLGDYLAARAAKEGGQ